MQIATILAAKGDHVVTADSSLTVADLLTLLNDHGIGAVVVTEGDNAVAGIVSERDVVRHLYRYGTDVLDKPVADIMTREVITTQPDADVHDLSAQMTEHRIRHVPVVVDGQLAGVVSIGDIVKSQLDDLHDQVGHLTAYLHN